MGAVILISSAAIVVAIVGCIFIWRADAGRAEEIEHTPPPPEADRARAVEPPSAPRSLDS